MTKSNRPSVWLSASAVAWCFVAGAWMSQVPMMRGGRYPTFPEIIAMIAVPAAACAAATWAARHRRTIVLGLSTGLVSLFTLVTGFSIGPAFLPAVGLLVWAIFVTLSDGPSAG